MRGTFGSLGARPVTDLRAFATILCRICAKSAHGPRVGRDRCASWSSRTCTRRRAAGARAVRARPGRGAAAPRRRRGRAVRVRARAAGAGGAALDLRRRYRGQRFDIVHAHFGLTAWPALLARLGPVVVTLHGNDLLVRRSYLATRAALPFTALTAAVSREFSENLPGAGDRRRVAVLPVGIDTTRFRPIPRAEARERLGLDPDGPYLLFPHDPSRPLKRHDRAVEAAGRRRSC